MTTKQVHVIRPFAQKDIGWTFITIKYDPIKKSLSITGVEGPLHNGDCRGSCGQINVHEWEPVQYTEGYDAQTIARLRDIWREHHLNDLRAGSPAQRAYLKANPMPNTSDHYRDACKALRTAGLNPDPTYIHNGKPYAYGSAWLREDVPQEVLEWLFSLPTTGASTLPAAWR